MAKQLTNIEWEGEAVYIIPSPTGSEYSALIYDADTQELRWDGSRLAPEYKSAGGTNQVIRFSSGVGELGWQNKTLYTYSGILSLTKTPSTQWCRIPFRVNSTVNISSVEDLTPQQLCNQFLFPVLCLNRGSRTKPAFCCYGECWDGTQYCGVGGIYVPAYNNIIISKWNQTSTSTIETMIFNAVTVENFIQSIPLNF